MEKLPAKELVEDLEGELKEEFERGIVRGVWKEGSFWWRTWRGN